MEDCNHKWEPVPRWWSRYRCTVCRAVGHRLNLSAPIKPYKCGIGKCKNAAKHVRKSFSDNTRKMMCDDHIEYFDRRMKEKYGLVRDDSTW